MSEENKALFRRFMDEVMSKRNVDAIDDFRAADYVEHHTWPGVEPGTAGMKQMMGMFFSAFPDLTTTVEQLVAEGDKVVGVMTTTELTGGNSWESRHPARKSPSLSSIWSESSTARLSSIGGTATTWQ